MRRILQIVLFSLIIISYSCSNSNQESTKVYNDLKKEQSVQINFIGHWLGEGKKQNLLEELKNEFEFKNQDITINMQYAEKVYFNRLVTDVEFIFNAKQAMSENPEWDIIRLNGEYNKVIKYANNNKFWGKEYLVDFSEIPEFRKNIKPELLTDEVKNQYGGIIPGPFLDGFSWPLWCNIEVAKRVGIDVKQFGMTNEDFIGYLKAVYDYNKAHNESIIPIYESGNWKTVLSIPEELFFSEMGNYDEIMNFKYSERKMQAWERVLKELERWSVYKPIAADWEKTTWTETTNYPLDGKCLFYSNASWMYNIWMKKDSSKLKNMLPTELPVFKTSPLCFGGYNIPWCVPKKAPHREQAIKFLLAMNSPDVSEKWARYTKSPCGIKGNVATSTFGFDKFENFQFMMDKKYGQHKMPLDYGSKFCFGENNSSVNNYHNEVITGKMTAEQAMKEIRKSIVKH